LGKKKVKKETTGGCEPRISKAANWKLGHPVITEKCLGEKASAKKRGEKER